MNIVRRWTAVPAALAVTMALLLSMVALGTRVPWSDGSFPYAGTGPEYGAPAVAAFSPLRDDYIRRVLGIGVDRPAGTETSLPSDGPLGAPAGRPEPVVLDGTNDDRDEAHRITSIPFTARSTAAGADREADDPGDCAAVGPTVWFRYTAATSVGLYASTAATGPVALAVYPGDTTAAAVCGSDPNGRARVHVAAVRGTTYYFQITMQLAGAYVFSLDPEALTVAASATDGGRIAGAHPHDGYPEVSGNGRHVAFVSGSPDLDPRCARRPDGSLPCGVQVYVRDLLSGTTELVSLTARDTVPNASGFAPTISADGRFVAWATRADDIVPGDAVSPMFGAREFDVYLRDRARGTTTRVTVAADGRELNGLGPSISEDGSRISFEADFEHRQNVYTGEAVTRDIYVKDMSTGEVWLASESRNGVGGNHHSISSRLSPDGRFVSFMSKATDLGSSDPVDEAFHHTGVDQFRVWTYDTSTRSVSPECVSEDGEPANDQCWGQAISRGGRYSVFWSQATNLVHGLPTPTGTSQFAWAYVRDRTTGALRVATMTDDGKPEPEVWQRNVPDNAKRNATSSISADGSVVAFETDAQLAAGDLNGITDAYVRDLRRGRTVRVSEGPRGSDPDDNSYWPVLSLDGSVVVFMSLASNLVAGDEPGTWDVFARTWRVR